MQPTDPKPDQNTDFLRKIGAKADRKLKAQREGKQHVWQGLGVMGLVGWSVAVPVLIGLFAGEWLDNCCPGKYTWTLNLLVIGLFLGCANVCNWIIKEQRAMHDDKEQKHD
jgi:ATP synthase protein I